MNTVLNLQLQAATFFCQDRNLLGKSTHLGTELGFVNLRQLVDKSLIFLQLPAGCSEVTLQIPELDRFHIRRNLIRHNVRQRE
jgi:hypothetical protein